MLWQLTPRRPATEPGISSAAELCSILQLMSHVDSSSRPDTEAGASKAGSEPGQPLSNAAERDEQQ